MLTTIKDMCPDGKQSEAKSDKDVSVSFKSLLLLLKHCSDGHDKMGSSLLLSLKIGMMSLTSDGTESDEVSPA